jgi:thiol-disulfide isomerase/thioredoxin
MMGIITEDDTTPTTQKVVNISGYDLSKVVIPQPPIGEYPISFYYKTDSKKLKTTAILNNGFVYFKLTEKPEVPVQYQLILRSIHGTPRIYKLDKTQFETSLKDITNTPNPLEIIEGPMNTSNKPTEKFKKLEELIKQGDINLPKDLEPDLTNTPKIELTTTMQGKSYVLDIWATFCGPCKKKIDEIMTPLNTELASSGLTFFYYSVDSNVRQLKEFADDKLSYATHAFDDKGGYNEILSKYGITSIPKSYFVDKEGNLYDLPETLQEVKDLILQHL